MTGSSYGKKGGTGPTKGQKGTRYRAEYGGKTYHKLVFKPVDGAPVMLLFEDASGGVHVNTVKDQTDLPAWAAEYIQVPAVLE